MPTHSIYTIKDCAAELGVSISFYRHQIMPLPKHPTPIGGVDGSGWMKWWGSQIREFVADKENLKWAS